jgi:N-acetylmuramoyl-L-alanine amidase
MTIERCEALHFERGRRGHRPRGVVLHTNCGSFASTLNWFVDPDSGVSAHYLVGLDGRTAQFVDELDTARHAGRVSNPTTPLFDGENPNLYTIGIEFEDGGDPTGVERPEAQYAEGAVLLARIAQRWDMPLDRAHVVGHRELTDAKSCPGNLDIQRLLESARRLG